MNYIVLALVSLGAQGVQAQDSIPPQWNATLDLGVGRSHNTFHSPLTYTDDTGASWPVDSLVRSDDFQRMELGVKAEWERTYGTLRWKVNAQGDRYANLTSANTFNLQSRLSFERDWGKRFSSLTEFRLRRAKRLGINILGDELLTSFSFYQTQLQHSTTYKAHKRLGLTLGLETYQKNYDVDAAAPDVGKRLDQVESTLELEFKWRIPGSNHKSQLDLVGKKKNRAFDLGVLSGGVDWRVKRYLHWLSDEILDPLADPMDPTPFLPVDSGQVFFARSWAYTTMRLRYDLPVAGNLRVRLEAHRQYRNDRSGGDFGFKGVKTAARLGYKQGAFSCSGTVSYTFRGYTDRRAEQAEPVALPRLIYEYARVRGKCAWEVRKHWSIWSELSYVNRVSNTTTIDRRTRRNYKAWDAVLGCGYTF